MYIQITNRCNMTCEHCCSSCTADGEDMSLEVFRKALDVAFETGHSLFLGGGEPTLHPNFYQILVETINAQKQTNIGMTAGMVTNGSIREKALFLAELNDKKVFSVSLSRTQFHDEIDEDVVKAFKESIRDEIDGEKIIAVGRARENGLGLPNSCVCSDISVTPSGDVYYCGCDDSPLLGNICENDIIEKLTDLESEIAWGADENCHRDSVISPILDQFYNEGRIVERKRYVPEEE